MTVATIEKKRDYSLVGESTRRAIETGLAIVADGAPLFDEPESIGLQKTDQFAERHRIAASRWSTCRAER